MHYLDANERAQLEALRLADSFVDETLRQVDRILASQKFARVQQKARDFLGYVVAKKLLGQADQIKELTIAMAVFGESSNFNPLESGKVRVAGVDLRQRLIDYYGGPGVGDPIGILIPPNTFVPDIHDFRVTIAVGLFENWHPHGDDDHLCLAISDEVADLLNQAGRIRATRVDVLPLSSTRPQYGLRGSLETRGTALRINASLSDLSTGQIVCWRSFEAQRDDVFKVTRELVSALLQRFIPPPTADRPAIAVSARRRSS